MTDSNNRNNTTRVALYARISTGDGRQDTENQLVQLREYCTRQGWAVTREYIVQASGKTSERDAFKRLFEDAPGVRSTWFWDGLWIALRGKAC
jgi:predicted site-specific integrase-resolvase